MTTTQTTTLAAAFATAKGCSTEVRIGSWRQPRNLFANYACIVLQVDLGCSSDCERCPARVKDVGSGLTGAGIEHHWLRGHVVLANEAHWGQDPEGKVPTIDVLGYLNGVLEE